MAAPDDSVKQDTSQCAASQLEVSHHQRDLAVRRAARVGQWDFVEQLVEAGISSKQRDFVLPRALRQDRWALVSRLLTLGVAAENRSLVVREGVSQGEWGVVLDALALGVAQDVVDKVFQEVVTQRQWQRVPALVRLFRRHDLTDFVLQAATRECQWGCVLQLIKIGLTTDQRMWVCHEALEWSHLECAIELLRQGIEPECAHRIVAECLKWNRGRDLVQLLQEDGTKPGVRDIVLGTTMALENWDAFLTILKAVGPTEKELVDAITTAVHTVNILLILQLLSLFTSTRRVFMQVVLRTQFYYSDVVILNNLLLDDHPDLVFHMFIAQEMWVCVLDMYDDARLHARGRRFALRQAIRKQAWQWVEKMADSAATSPRDRRHVFLQAARQGQWRLVLGLSAQSIRISLSDRVFSLRTWLKLGQWQSVEEVFRTWDHPKQKKMILKCVLEEAIVAGELATFLKVCFQVHFKRIDEGFIFEMALAHDKCNFVMEFCRRHCTEDVFKVALELSMTHKKWKIVKEMMEDIDSFNDVCCDDEDIVGPAFQLCLRGVCQDQNTWHTLVPVLDVFCHRLSPADICLIMDLRMFFERSDARQDVRKLTDWCLQTSHGNLALLLSVMLGEEELVSRVTDQLQDGIYSEVFKVCFAVAVKNSDWESAVRCLQCPSIAEEEGLTHYIQLDSESDLSDLIGKCRERELHKWATYLGVCTRDWDHVRTDLEHCQDISVVDLAIEAAAEDDEWDIVQTYFARCSQDPALLRALLPRAVRSGHSDCCRMLMARMDALLARSISGALLHAAVISFGDREEMVKLCIEAGFSTHVQPCDSTVQDACWICRPSPMQTAIHNGQLPLVELLLTTGACSHKELFQFQHDPDLKTRLTDKGRHDILQFLNREATTPRTLQGLCRLQVSHLLDCRPGRLERVMSLDVPWPVHDLIKFNDVLF